MLLLSLHVINKSIEFQAWLEIHFARVHTAELSDFIINRFYKVSPSGVFEGIVLAGCVGLSHSFILSLRAVGCSLTILMTHYPYKCSAWRRRLPEKERTIGSLAS